MRQLPLLLSAAAIEAPPLEQPRMGAPVRWRRRPFSRPVRLPPRERRKTVLIDDPRLNGGAP